MQELTSHNEIEYNYLKYILVHTLSNLFLFS